MAKRSGDLILRDRLQFTLDGSGDLATVYGRMDFSAYTNGKNGLAIKEVRFHLRDPTDGGNTGNFSINADTISASGSSAGFGAYKLYATTRAYENAADVGIASPDVVCVEEGQWIVSPAVAPTTGNWAVWDRSWYGPEDLHPEGFTCVSDLLIGIAFDTWDNRKNDTLELDVMIIADKITITTERMNALLTQQQDL